MAYVIYRLTFIWEIMFKDMTGQQRMDEIIGPLMKEEIEKNHPRGDYVIDEHYMCIGGILYFKCEGRCKCWCVYEDQHEHGYRICSFCENLAKEEKKVKKEVAK